MNKTEAAKELISSIDRVFEIEAEIGIEGFEYLFDKDWAAIGQKIEFGKEHPIEKEHVQFAQEAQVLNARISALACEAGLRDRGWDAGISFDSYRCEHRKHFKEYFSGWAPNAKLPPFIWSVPGKLRILKEEAIICQRKEAGAEETPPTKIEANGTKPAGTEQDDEPQQMKYKEVETFKQLADAIQEHIESRCYVKNVPQEIQLTKGVPVFSMNEARLAFVRLNKEYNRDDLPSKLPRDAVDLLGLCNEAAKKQDTVDNDRNEATDDKRKRIKEPSKEAKSTKGILTGITDEKTAEVSSRCNTDDERLRKAQTLEDLLAVLENILPYWKLHYELFKFDADFILRTIRAVIVYHNRKTTINLPPVPRDLTEVDDWVVSVRKLIKIKRKTICTKPAETNENTKHAVDLPEAKPKIQKWAELTINFIDNETLRFKTKSGQWSRVNYAELGFKDKKKGSPNKPWEIFLLFAEVHHDGYIDFSINQSTQRKQPYGGTQKRAAFMKCKDRICKTLKDYFGPQEVPIRYVKKEQRWQVKFTLSDGRPKRQDRP